MLAEVSNNTLGALLRCNVRESESLPLLDLRREQEQSTIRIDYDRSGFFFKWAPPARSDRKLGQELARVPFESCGGAEQATPFGGTV
jgi:hypothetical protein